MSRSRQAFKYYILAFVLILFIIMMSIYKPKSSDPPPELPTTTLGLLPSQILTPHDVFQNGKQFKQDDPRLLSFILDNHLYPPSPKPYKLKDPTGDPSVKMGIREFVQGLLGQKRDGFFIECGGLDGEFYSNTLVLERDFGWRGLLVEADPDYVPKLIGTHRKAWFADVCLSLEPWSQTARMEVHGIMGWSVISNTTRSDSKTVEVKCIPIFSLLAALDVFTVDYFSLDIEGNELKVLQTIPFDKVIIKAFSIETGPATQASIKTFMLSKEYIYVKRIETSEAHDDIYLHSSVMQRP